jgi:hypothetical protein
MRTFGLGNPTDGQSEATHLRWEQRDLEAASSVSLPTIKRLESKRGMMAAHTRTLAALKNALEAAGIKFIDENGGGAGVRLRKRWASQS